VTGRVTARVAVFGVIAVVGFVGGLGLGRPELIAIAAAPVLILAVGVVRDEAPAPEFAATLGRERALEGEWVDLEVVVAAAETIRRVELLLEVPAGLTLHAASDESRGRRLSIEGGAVAVRVDADTATKLRFVLRCDQWGGYRLGPLTVRSEATLGVRHYAASYDLDLILKVFPPEHALRELLAPLNTQLNLGELVSRRVGEGIEFAELHPFGEGDDPRRINWRASTRKGSLWMNRRHPERNSDIVLLIDAIAGGRIRSEQTLNYAVRASASIVSSHLGRRDRVGLMMMGGRIVWLRPRMFDLQRYKILEALTDSRLRPPAPGASVAIPPRVLPPQAMLIALTPLIDDEVVAALNDIVGRGHDTAIVEIAPEPFLDTPDGPIEELGRRIWLLQREVVRRRFRGRGVAVVEWDPRTPFENALRSVASFRRAMRRAPA
jgi:uncharacterized protein (DUF58 family)